MKITRMKTNHVINLIGFYMEHPVFSYVVSECSGKNTEEAPGFKKVKLAPMPDYRMSHAECRYDSPVGTYEIGWWIEESGKLRFRFVIPFDASAQIVLPDAELGKVKWVKDESLCAEQVGTNVVCAVGAGVYEFVYEPTVSYQRTYGTYMTFKEMLAKEDIREAVFEVCPRLKQLPVEIFGHKVMEEMVPDPGCMLSMQDVENVDKVLAQYKVIPDEHGGMIMDI